jgi:DNA-binding Lrp family transcriptional regulator
MATEYNIIRMTFDTAKQPEFCEVKADGLIKFGNDNLYPNYLMDLFNTSPKHGAIVKGKANYIYGKGFDIEGSANGNGETWNQIFKKSCLDDELYDGYYLQIIWNVLGKIAAVHNIEYHKVRIYKNGKYGVKNDWNNSDSKEKPRIYDAFNLYNKVGTQILFIKHYNPKSDYYPLPNYIPCLNYLEADVKVSQHILRMAKRQFIASKLINLNNGEPANEQKEEVEKGIKKKFNTTDGDTVVLSFNKNKESEVTITDLGTTQLTKEDFTNVNNLIQQEIYAGHQITSPILFGIKTEGQLGGRSEMRDAYEIFKNTYVNERQQCHEETFNKIFELAGKGTGYKITPVEPIGEVFTEQTLLAIGVPKKYFFDKLGITLEEYPEIGSNAPSGQVSTEMVNDNIKNLTAKQHQQLTRIIRQFSKGQLTQQAATALLKTGLGLNDSDINNLLGIDDNIELMKFSEDVLMQKFSEYSEPKNLFTLVKQMDLKQTFKTDESLTVKETEVLKLINKDKLVSNEIIAKALNVTPDEVSAIVSRLSDSGYLKITDTERTLMKPLSEIEKPRTQNIVVRYSYEGPKDDRNRDFCRRLLDIDGYFSRESIEKMSEIAGYSVWDRRGGWLTLPDGDHQPFCRHRWVANVLIKK